MFCTSLFVTLLKCPVKNSETFSSPLAKGGQGCHRDSQVTSCSIAQTGASALCSGSKKRSWISYRNTFPLQGSLSNSKSFKKTPFLGLSVAPQWRCLTQVVVASHSVSFCCCFNVCEVEWKSHRNSWLSFPGRTAQLHLGARRAPQRETWTGDKGATSSAGTWHLQGCGQGAPGEPQKFSVLHPPLEELLQL